MKRHTRPLHIVSAQIAELGVTFGRQAVNDKSNEIPAVRELIELLDLEGCMIAADALNCQKETAQTIIAAKADYVLNVKDNHPELKLKRDIAEYAEDEALRKAMDSAATVEKNRGRIEKRTAYTAAGIGWLYGKEERAHIACMGAINTCVRSSEKTTNERHYYISNRRLSAGELLKHARYEWPVETMHWLLDVHFREDFCRIAGKHVQQNLNIMRKAVLNSIKRFKQTSGNKRPISNIMFDCLLKPEKMLPLLQKVEN